MTPLRAGAVRALTFPPLLILLALTPYLIRLGERHFQSDDYWFIGDSWSTVARAFSGDWLAGRQGAGGWFRPLPRVAFWLDDQVWGLRRPWGHHLTNILLHAVNGYSVGLLTIPLVQRRRLSRADWMTWPAGAAPFVCLLFLWYPPSTGAVSWVAARTDLMALLGMLAALVATVASGPALPRWLLCAVAASFAYLSKEPAFILPGLLLAYGLVSAPKGERRAWMKATLPAVAATILPLLAVVAWRRATLGGLGGYVIDLGDPAALLGRFGEYLAAVFSPITHSFPPEGLVAALTFLVLATSVVLLTPGREALALAGAGIILLAWAPLHTLPMTAVEDDRFLVVSSVGFAWLLGALWPKGGQLTSRCGWRLFLLPGAVAAACFLGLVDRDDRWIVGGQAAAFYRERTEEALAVASPEAPLVGVALDMDPDRYMIGYPQRWRGGKVLPWDQFVWMMGRHQPAQRERFLWGVTSEAARPGTELLILTRDAPEGVRWPDPRLLPCTVRRVEVHHGEDLWSEAANAWVAPEPAPAPGEIAYQFAQVELTSSRFLRPEWTRRVGERKPWPAQVRSMAGAFAGQRDVFTFQLGFRPPEHSAGPWILAPHWSDEGVEVHRVEFQTLFVTPRAGSEE